MSVVKSTVTRNEKQKKLIITECLTNSTELFRLQGLTHSASSDIPRAGGYWLAFHQSELAIQLF